jgi:hypothetical protein
VPEAAIPVTDQPGRHRADTPRPGVVARQSATQEAAAQETAAHESEIQQAAVQETAAQETAAQETAVQEIAAEETTARGTGARDTAAGVRQMRPGEAAVPADGEDSLIADGVVIREQWMRVQAAFVDDPRAAMTAAASIITDVSTRLEAAVRARQQTLRDRWEGNGQPDTEALRVTMQQYRALLERLAGL